MAYDVLLEQIEDNGYVARVLAWPDCVVQGATRADAIAQARMAILERLAHAEIVPIVIEPPTATHPWLPFAGMWADEPMMNEVLCEIERYRREIDAEHKSQEATT